MDFSTFSTTDLADSGSWLHLEHPATGEPLYLDSENNIGTVETDKPCRVLVRGNRSDAVQKVFTAKTRADELAAARFLRATGKEADRLAIESARRKENHTTDLLLATVADWENIVVKREEGPVSCTPENVVRALKHPKFMTQIFDRSADETALFQNAPTG
jgi:hypothetical protein